MLGRRLWQQTSKGAGIRSARAVKCFLIHVCPPFQTSFTLPLNWVWHFSSKHQCQECVDVRVIRSSGSLGGCDLSLICQCWRRPMHSFTVQTEDDFCKAFESSRSTTFLKKQLLPKFSCLSCRLCLVIILSLLLLLNVSGMVLQECQPGKGTDGICTNTLKFMVSFWKTLLNRWGRCGWRRRCNHRKKNLCFCL